MPETAEKIFAATQADLEPHASSAIGDDPILAAGAFWPNGVNAEAMEHGTVGGHHLGAVLGPNLGAMVALAGAFAGRDEPEPDHYAMAKPLIVAVTATQIHIIEPAVESDSARIFKTFDRATTRVEIKHRGMSRIVVLADDEADQHFRLHASTAPYMKRSGPEKAVLAALAVTD